MSDWRTLTIGDVCQTISETYHGNDERVVLINTSDVLEGKVLNHQSVENKDLRGQFKKTFRENDILYSEIRPANKRYAFIDFENTEGYIASTKLMVLRSDARVVLPKYLYAFLTSSAILAEMQHLAESRSGTFPQITFSSELAPTPISVPDFETQGKIVRIIDIIDKKIETNKKINENLLQQAQALYIHMFADNESVTPATIAEVALNVTDGVHNTVHDDPKGDFLLLSCKNIKGGFLSIGPTERRISKDTFEKLRRRTKLAKGDVLISSVGTVGELLMLNTEPTNYEFQRSVAIVKPNPEIVSAAYLYESLVFQRAELINSAHGAVQQCLFISDIAGFPINIPHPEDLQIFNGAVVPMFDAISANEAESRALAEMRDLLLPQLMSGELDVSDLDL